MKTQSKKRRRLRLQHPSSAPHNNNTADTMDGCLDDFGMGCSDTANDAETSRTLNNEDELPPSDANGDKLGNISQETAPTEMQFKDPHDLDNSSRDTTMSKQEGGEHHEEPIGDVQLGQSIKSMNMAQGGTQTTDVHGDGKHSFDLQATTLPNVYDSANVLQDRIN